LDYDLVKRVLVGVEKMRYRRGEAFRFEFGESLPIRFTIDELNGNAVKTSEGSANMLDLSLKGMKIVSPLSIPYKQGEKVKITIHFQLNHNFYSIQGNIVWKKQRFSDYFYGIHSIVNPSIQERILEDLKIIGKRMA
jgi:hypothetical protein